MQNDFVNTFCGINLDRGLSLLDAVATLEPLPVQFHVPAMPSNLIQFDATPFDAIVIGQQPSGRLFSEPAISSNKY